MYWRSLKRARDLEEIQIDWPEQLTNLENIKIDA
jgi:hypothetical protein